MATYAQNQEKYAAVQWTGIAADLDAFLAIFDPNRRGLGGGQDNNWTYTVNADGSLRAAGGFNGFRDIPAGEWMVCGPDWGTPQPGGLVDGAYGDPMNNAPDVIGFTDTAFQARFTAAT